MKITQATFRMTGWLCRVPKLAKKKGASGEFNAMTIEMSIEKSAKPQTESKTERAPMEFYRYFVEVSGKIAEAIDKNIEAGDWRPGDRIEVEGDINTRVYDKELNNGKGYERPVFKAMRVFNGTAYDRNKIANKEKYAAKTETAKPDNDGMPNIKAAGDISFETFPFGENGADAGITL